MVLAHDSSKRTQDVQISEDVTFTTMLLSTKTEQGLRDAGFLKPSPIQLHGIPLGKCGFDLLLEAKSGTGKTAVFTVIALEKIDLSKSLQVVILAPTREIAAQICDVTKQIGLRFEGLRVEVVMGGLPVEEDIAKFKNKRKVQIVVGSPGRLRHLIQDGYIDTSAVRLLVLDEADKLMEKSFQVDINYIFSCLPAQKQVIMSSATYPESTKTFINQYVKNSQLVSPNTTNILIGIEQKVTHVMCNCNVVRQTKLRYEELIKILSAKQFKQCLIFCNYQARVVELHKLLTKDKWPSEQLYGKQEQLERLEALKTLQEYKCRILVSTDLAARGIDASNVDLVINFEPPYDWQTYLHRIGRAGRFGSYGIAVTILSIGKEEIHFKKSLNFMKDSLNICDIWTNKKYNIASSDTDMSPPAIENDTKSKQSMDEQNGNNKPPSIESDNSTETVTCLENTSEDILNEIEKEIYVNDFLNFETQNSYHEQVKTFADLLKSYENDTGIKDEDTYNNTLDCEKVKTEDSITLKMNDESLELNDKLSQNWIRQLETEEPDANVKQVSFLADLINQSREHQEDSLHNSKKDNNYQFSKINQNSGNVNQIEPSISDYDSEEIEKDTIYVNKCSLNRHSNPRHSKTKQEDVNELINPYNEMTLMGLPTEFRSARNLKNRNNNLKHSIPKPKSRFKEQNYHSYLDQECDNVNENHNKQGNESYKQYKERKTYKNKVVNQQHEPKFIQKPNDKADAESSADGEYSHANYDQMSKSKYQTTDTSYINWYNQLKMRTKQIEMALYIEELSKM